MQDCGVFVVYRTAKCLVDQHRDLCSVDAFFFEERFCNCFETGTMFVQQTLCAFFLFSCGLDTAPFEGASVFGCASLCSLFFPFPDVTSSSSESLAFGDLALPSLYLQTIYNTISFTIRLFLFFQLEQITTRRIQSYFNQSGDTVGMFSRSVVGSNPALGTT